MNVARIYNCCIYLVFYICFQLKNFDTEKTTKKIEKTKEEKMKHLKESIMISEIFNQDIENSEQC